jgi:hypothetical protein
MKKLIFFLIGSCFFPLPVCKGFSPDVGKTFVILEGKYIPLFTRAGTKFEYRCDAHGMNCNDLDTVLPPGTFIRIDEVGNDNTIRVFCRVSEEISIAGFVHSSFFSNSVSPMDNMLFDGGPTRSVRSVKDICKILDSYIGKNVPFGWGCNTLEEVDLKGLYEFECVENNGVVSQPKYECVGFDCSGLLHSISSWTLPHSTVQLYDLRNVECLCELDHESSDEELADALAKMVDTDFVVSKEAFHVIISFHGGFIEGKGMARGIVFTSDAHAMERLKTLISKGKVRVIRWHPELLKAF